MRELNPPVESLVELVVAMVDGTWPTTEEERQRFYGRLGLTELQWDSSEVDQRKGGRTVSHRFVTTLPRVDGMDTMFRGEFLGLSLFAYNEPGDDGAESRTAFPLLKDMLSARLGAPAEEWGTSREPACYWAVGPLQVEMYCFQRLSSGVMLGPSHAGRSAANDREAAADPRNRSGDRVGLRCVR